MIRYQLHKFVAVFVSEFGTRYTGDFWATSAIAARRKARTFALRHGWTFVGLRPAARANLHDSHDRLAAHR